MKKRIRASSVLVGLYLIVLLIDMRLLYLVHADWMWMLPVTFVAVLFSFFVRTRLKYVVYKTSDQYIRIYFWCSFIILFMDVIWSYFSYPLQGIRGAVRIFSYYSPIFLVFPLYKAITNRNIINKLLKKINYFSFAWYVIIIAQQIIYNRNGRIIIPEYFADFQEDFSLMFARNGIMRIALMGFCNVMIIYNFYMLYVPKGKIGKKTFNILSFVIGIIELLFVQQSRVSDLVIFGCIFIIVLLDHKSKSKVIRRAIIVFLAMAVVWETGILEQVFRSFGLSGGGLQGYSTYSTSARLYGVAYYWTTFLENPLFGIGLADSVHYEHIVFGPQLMARTSDVGIAGQLARIGIFVIPIYIVPLFRIFWISIKYYRKSKSDASILLMAFAAYLFGSSATFIILDAPRIVMWPFFICLFEYIYVYEMHSSSHLNIKFGGRG